jgi:hypothetical protein
MIIKKVPGRFVPHLIELIECQECNSVWTIKYEVDGELLEHHPEFLQLKDKECKCGGICTHKKNEWEEYQKGYVVVKCDCGRKVECHHFTNTCECGADYNWNGELLAPRSQWGAETGEDWYECY